MILFPVGIIKVRKSGAWRKETKMSIDIDIDYDAIREEVYGQDDQGSISDASNVENHDSQLESSDNTNENETVGESNEASNEEEQEGQAQSQETEDEFVVDQPEEQLDPQLQELSQRVKEKQSPEVNRAFAEMRRRLKEAERYEKFLKRIAENSGVSVDRLMEMAEQREMEMKAEEMGVKPEIYRRLTALEEQNKELKKQADMNRFMAEVDLVKTKYGLKDDELKETFAYIGRNGYLNPETSVPLINFEDAYKLANFDRLLERKSKEIQQQQLAAKKQRQQAAPIAHRGSNAPESEPDFMSMSSEEFRKFAEKQGLSLD